MNYKLNWSEAAKYGLLLASLSVVINLVTGVFQLSGLLNVLLSVLKLCGSVYIVYYVMRRNAQQWDTVTYGQSFGFGVAVCTFSAIVCTLFYLLTYVVILPDTMTNLIEQLYGTYEAMGIAGAIDYDMLVRSMPVILAFSQFIGCVICGLIVSAIIASAVKKNSDNNPFGSDSTYNSPE